MTKATLVMASANPDKVAELAALLAPYFEVLPRPVDAPETIEDEPTLAGNSLKKAREICELTGQPALADDTGLFVDALEGGPGVRTARYAGEASTYEENVTKMLAELAGVEDRRAEFRTSVVVAYPDGTHLEAIGSVEGDIAPERTGDGGFGYDPIFVPRESDGRSFAQMNKAEKNSLSHRARALAALLAKLG